MVKFCPTCKKILPIIEKNCPFCKNENLFRYCKECKRIILPSENVCPSCGDIDGRVVQESDIKTKNVTSGSVSAIKSFGTFFIILFILMGIYQCGSSIGSSGLKDSHKKDESWAMVIAQDIVSNRLKAPSTAKYSWPNETNVSLKNDTWTVSGWVDAQNGFGAMIRSNYTVRFKSLASSEYGYSLVSCNIS